MVSPFNLRFYGISIPQVFVSNASSWRILSIHVECDSLVFIFFIREFGTGASGKLGEGFCHSKKGFESIAFLDGEK